MKNHEIVKCPNCLCRVHPILKNDRLICGKCKKVIFEGKEAKERLVNFVLKKWLEHRLSNQSIGGKTEFLCPITQENIDIITPTGGELGSDFFLTEEGKKQLMRKLKLMPNQALCPMCDFCKDLVDYLTVEEENV